MSFRSPNGATVSSQGRKPLVQWSLRPSRSPNGATVIRGLSPRRGCGGTPDPVSQGLAPLATDGRPVGARRKPGNVATDSIVLVRLKSDRLPIAGRIEGFDRASSTAKRVAGGVGAIGAGGRAANPPGRRTNLPRRSVAFPERDLDLPGGKSPEWRKAPRTG